MRGAALIVLLAAWAAPAAGGENEGEFDLIGKQGVVIFHSGRWPRRVFDIEVEGLPDAAGKARLWRPEALRRGAGSADEK